MAKAMKSPAHQSASKVQGIASIREPRPKKVNKNGRRVSAITQQLIDKIDAINEEGNTLRYETEESFKQNLPLWVASQIVSSREVPNLKKRLRLAKQAIRHARRMNDGITYASKGAGVVRAGVYSQAYLLRSCKANHPSTGVIRTVKEEVAA